MTGRERILAACRSEPVDRPPVWLMRQAGRYLPEYHELKGGRDFWTLVRTPELASEITLQPVRRFGMDAAIIFSDILIVPHAMGVKVAWSGSGPELDGLVSGMEDVERLVRVDADRDFPWLGEAIGRVAGEAGGRALVGFAGAPFTLAAYMVQGRVSYDLAPFKTLAYGSPGVLDALLSKITDAVADLLLMQVRAGADVVQIFDSWAGLLSPDDYERWALPGARDVIGRMSGSGVPVILYVNGAAGLVELMASSGCDVLGLDAGIRLDQARERTGGCAALQGNLDPARLLGPVSGVREGVRGLVAQTGGRGHILNLGHGVLPSTPPAAVEAFVGAAGGVSA
jgi:uroporphyrinogen decarboxylase